MMSNPRRPAMTVIVAATAISRRMPGSVIWMNSANRPAPSTAAASYRLGGIFCTPAMNKTMHSPNSAQVPMRPTEGSAQVKLPSQSRANPPSPTALSRPLIGPSYEYAYLQATATATDAMTCGRNMMVRNAEPPLVLTRDSTDAMNSPTRMGMTE